jgi:DNA-binding response OmpR family regulator
MPDRVAHGSLDGCGDERDGSRIDAFIIDNDPLMTELLERLLARRGLAALRFDNPAKLLDELAAAVPSLIFTDLDMPRMSGADLIKAARERGFGKTVVLVTASRDREAVGEAIAGGADEILTKPLKEFELDCLIDKVRARARRRGPSIEWFRAILEPVSQGVIALDAEGNALFANKRAREILDAEGAEELANAIGRGGIAHEIRKNRSGSGAIAFVDVSTPGGEGRHPVGVEVHRLPPAVSGLAHLVLMHDFSEWRKLDELHSRFATYLSHRMRTPLTSVRNAVRILSEQDEDLGVAEKERFLDIGSRNVERLIDSFDEIQKIFMVESGEINSCRSFVRIGKEVQSILGECEQEGMIEGFKVHSPECAAFMCRSRLKSYLLSAVDAMTRWLGVSPYIDCIVSAHDASEEAGDRESMLSLSLIPRGRAGDGRIPLADFLNSREAQRGMILESLAHAMDGTSAATARGALRLLIPAEPSFNREKDLVHPLHVMLERAELGKIEFHHVSVRMTGTAIEAPRFGQLLAGNLSALFCEEDAIVSRGEEPSSFNAFVVGASRARIHDAMEGLRERFAHSCRERGEELYPSIRWEITYSREAGSAPEQDACALLESLV